MISDFKADKDVGLFFVIEEAQFISAPQAGGFAAVFIQVAELCDLALFRI